MEVRDVLDHTWRLAKPALGLLAALVLFRLILGKRLLDGWPMLLVFIGLLIAGLALFIAGAVGGIVPLGEATGRDLGLLKHKALIVCAACAIGYVSTLLEPGLRVLAAQVEETSVGAIPQRRLVTVVAIGFAIGMGVGIAKMTWGFPSKPIFIIGLLGLSASMLAVPDYVVGIALDCASAATGPLNIPLLVAFATGLSQVVHGADPVRHGFGLLGMAAIGSTGAVLFLGAVSGR